MLLAEGHTAQQVAAQIGKGLRTVERWKADTEFAAEVDRLSLMAGIASRAERMCVVQRAVRQKVSEEFGLIDKDLLDWLKFAQSETDGVKLDWAAFHAAFGGEG